jgi:DNA polymerase-1
MIVICDIETNGLKNPDRLWLIVCKEIESGKVHVFKEPDRNPYEFSQFAKKVTQWVGHNFLAFDYRHINRLCSGVSIDPTRVVDTLVISRLTNFLRKEGHSLSSFGDDLNLPKLDFNDWSSLSEDMIEYCVRDVEINYKLYLKQLPFIQSPLWKKSLRVEHDLVLVCNSIQDHGFFFDKDKAQEVYLSVSSEVSELEASLTASFPPKTKLYKEVLPRATKYGTLHKAQFKWLEKLGGDANDLLDYTPGYPFSVFTWEPFNPGSTSQIVERLNEAGWKPKEKTKGHYIAWKEYERNGTKENAERLAKFLQTGWSISEANLATLPEDAPPAAKSLARYLLLRNRKKLLETWLEAVGEDGRIHPTLNGLGAWTHRMSHTDPNLANVPTEKPQDPDDIKELNQTLRSLFCVPKDRLLIGVDADSIQLRILAHYMNDPKFTEALINGDKSKGTDLHSLNAVALGAPCKGRRDAKTFIYAWLLGAGVERVAEILGCSIEEAKKAREDFLAYYPGLQKLKQVQIPFDAARGYFEGLDNRFVSCYGEDEAQRRHYMLGGYLQNGEKVVMAHANIRWRARLDRERVPYWQVNFVHDEWQTETLNDMDLAMYIANVQAESIKEVGLELNLRCPMAGSILGAHEAVAIGRNWRETH